LGHLPWPKVASPRANAHCLRPQAEFARSSGRGLRQVKNFIKDEKGMCKKKIKGKKLPTQNPEDPDFMNLRFTSFIILKKAFGTQIKSDNCG
jgi:hypothetical protein